VTFVFLADRPEYRAVLAGWYLREWPDLFDTTFTILALDGRTLFGAASLLAEDVLPLPECSPWLGSVVVDPARRGRGRGRQIVAAAMEHARAIGIETLHLWTPHHRAFYEKLGWKFVRDHLDDFRSVAILQFHFCKNPA
jgi:N-acetylglutamate synthase-like GNAT family acetyltransferase